MTLRREPRRRPRGVVPKATPGCKTAPVKLAGTDASADQRRRQGRRRRNHDRRSRRLARSRRAPRRRRAQPGSRSRIRLEFRVPGRQRRRRDRALRRWRMTVGAPVQSQSRSPGETATTDSEDSLVLAGRSYRSRLLVGTGKYADFEQTRIAIETSGAEIVTVAVRRVNITDPTKPNLLDFVDPKRFTILPNTAGCYTAEDAIRTCRLAREAGIGKL